MVRLSVSEDRVGMAASASLDQSPDLVSRPLLTCRATAAPPARQRSQRVEERVVALHPHRVAHRGVNALTSNADGCETARWSTGSHLSR